MLQKMEIPGCVKNYNWLSPGYFEIQKRMEEAINHALPKELSNTHLEGIIRFNKELINGQGPIDRELLNGSLKRFEKDPTYIVSMNLVDYAKVIKVVSDNSKTELDLWSEDYYHEVAHWKKAIELDFPEPFMISYFIKKEKPNEFRFHGGTVLGKIPESMSDEEYRHNRRLVIKAPPILSNADASSLR